MSLRIAVGADHAGFSLKKSIADYLSLQGHHVTDFGAYSTEPGDQPDFAHPVAQAVERGESTWGILVGDSGNGVAITANKHPGIRAGVAWNTQVAALVRQHNDANVLCVPSRFISLEEALACVNIFLKTNFEKRG